MRSRDSCPSPPPLTLTLSPQKGRGNQTTHNRTGADARRPERRRAETCRGAVEVSRGVDAIDFKWYQNKRNAAQNPPVDFGFGKGGVCADSRRQGVASQIPASTISRLGDFERPGWR